MEKSSMQMPVQLNPNQVLPFAERAKLVTGEYSDACVGYATMFDGTGYASDVTFLPGVSAEMVHWYFNWRGLEPQNYALINAQKNLSALTMQGIKSRDEDLTVYERYWDTTQTVVTLTGLGPATRYENFKCPSDVGFPFDIEGGETPNLVCIRGYHEGEPPAAGPDYFLCHQLIEADGGLEIRTKKWIGWTVRYGMSFKSLPDGFFMQPMMAMGELMELKAEMGQLAAVLPDLYAANH